MIKVIENIPHVINCATCHSMLEYEMEDIEIFFMGSFKIYYIICPICGKRIFIA